MVLQKPFNDRSLGTCERRRDVLVPAPRQIQLQFDKFVGVARFITVYSLALAFN